MTRWRWLIGLGLVGLLGGLAVAQYGPGPPPPRQNIMVFPAKRPPHAGDPPPVPDGVMTWAQRAAQSGVVIAVEMSSFADIQSGGAGTTVLQDPSPGVTTGGFITYDATENAMKITVPTTMGAPGLAYTKSIPYAQQFGENTDLWLQFDAKWDAGMLTPSVGGGGIKFLSIDMGNRSDGTSMGNCSNDMQGEVNLHVRAVTSPPTWTFPGMYHSCGYVIYPGDTSGRYYDMVSYSGSEILLQNQVVGCTYNNPTPCLKLIANEWHTFTVHMKIGTWYRNNYITHGDSQVDYWMQHPSLNGGGLTFIHSQTPFDLANATPATAKYGKIWLYPYDTNRSSSSVDGHVWYRRLLVANQPLKDPATGLSIGPPANTSPPTMTASDLGVTGEDYVGTDNQITPNGTPDHHISVAGLRGTPFKVRIYKLPGSLGVWETPYNGQNWIIHTAQGSSTTADYWFEPFTAGTYHVKVTYVDNTTDEADATVAAPGDPTLTVSRSGVGTVTDTTPGSTIDCGSDCTQTATSGTAFVLTAAAGTNYTFTGWSGAGCSGTGTCSFNLTANTTVSATFTPTASGGPGIFTIADNGWQAITPNASSRYLIPQADTNVAVAVDSATTAQSTPGPRSYTGLAYGNGNLIYFGGVHTSWPGNDVEVYHITTNVWEQSWKPEVCLNLSQLCGGVYTGSSSPYRTVLNRPYGEHTYQRNYWRPDLNLFEIFTRGTGPFRFDPVAKTIVERPYAQNPQGYYYPWNGDVSWEHAFWAPDISDSLYIGTGGGIGQGVFRQSCGTSTPRYWCLVGGIPSGTADGTFYSTYVTSQNKHFMMVLAGGDTSAQPNTARKWYWFDSTTMAFTLVTLASGPDVADGFDYDAKNDRIILLQDSTSAVKVWACTTAATPVCTQQTLTASPPSNASQKVADVRSISPSWVYDAPNNVFWYLSVFFTGFNGGPANLWVYRYKN